MYQCGKDYTDKDGAKRMAKKLLNKGATMTDIQNSGSPLASYYLKVQIPEEELDFDPRHKSPIGFPDSRYWAKK